MRKVIRTIAAAAIFFSLTNGMAKEPTVVMEGHSKNLMLEWDTQYKETSISFSDVDGNIIYSEHLENVETYAKKLNLSTLAEGKYLLSIENSLRKINYAIVIGDDSIKITERKENTKPVFRTKNEVVYLNLLNLQKEIVSISILDSEDRVVFTETIRNKPLVQKAFNFTDAFNDTYTIRVNDGTDTFYENIVVE